MKLSDLLKNKYEESTICRFVSWYESQGKSEIYIHFDGEQCALSDPLVNHLNIEINQNLEDINRYLQDDGIKIIETDDVYSFVLLDNI